eukprot:Skav204248  [mRNA]  locus=scaffold2414:27301:32524:- [translate_table: standard]
MVSFGQSAADTEDIVFQVCKAMELPIVYFEVGTRNIHASFAGIVHSVPFARGINADKLASTISLANLMMMRVGSIQGASDLLDDIFEHRPTYSPFIHYISFCFLSVLASLAAFMGTSRDAAAVAAIVPFVVLVQVFCRKFHQWADLEAFLVALVVGMLTPLASTLLKAPLCEIPAIYLSPLLVYLPGSQLIYGAYEIQFGSLVNGVSQLGSCVVRCMFLAMALLIGWQVFGHNFYHGKTSSSAAASLVMEYAPNGELFDHIVHKLKLQEDEAGSGGVVLYALLCGSLPFDDENVPNLFRKIKHGNFTLPGTASHLSSEAKDLIVQMLVVDPTRRITFSQIRKHSWFQKESLSVTILSVEDHRKFSLSPSESSGRLLREDLPEYLSAPLNLAAEKIVWDLSIRYT